MIKKLWFWVSFALFIIPEILWSPVVNLTNAFLKDSNNTNFLRPNFLMNHDNVNALLLVLIVQFFGLLNCLVFCFRTKLNTSIKILLAIIFLILTIITGFIFYLVFYTRNGIGF